MCHSCDNPPCCNPAHIWLGTQKQNIEDMYVKGRNLTSETNGSAKLTLKEVEKIWKLDEKGNLSRAAIARKFNVSSSNISMILNGRSWKN